MGNAKKQLLKIFKELDERIGALNQNRLKSSLPMVAIPEIKILGQMSLLSNEKISAILSLAQTADLDALLVMEPIIKKELKDILGKYGLLYDEDSHLIWLPKEASFEILFEFKNLVVRTVDPESALVSKAVKAPGKNKQLVRQAIATGEFPNLVERIEKNGGDLEFFAKD